MRHRLLLFSAASASLLAVWLAPPAAAPAATVTPAESPPAGPPPAAPELTPEPARPLRVVIISEDGLRPDLITPELMPRHVQLLGEGLTAQLARTIRHSDTLPSHAAMLSGADVHEHGLSWNSYKPERGQIRVPTVFSVARAHGLSTAMIVGKPKLRHIAVPGAVDHFERPSYLCGGVSRRAAEYFVAAKPDLLFVHFSDPDEAGHADGWMSPSYVRAIQQSDRCLATVLAAIDGSDVAGETLVIVTADHGGHGHAHSGGNAEVDRVIPWIVRGPGVTPGTSLEADVSTVDTAATALAALRLPQPPTMLGTARVSF